MASDYSLTAPSIASVAASITPEPLTATATIGGTLSKTYDGSNAATGASVIGSVQGAISGDTLVLNTTPVSLRYNGTHVVGTNAIVASGNAGFSISSSTDGSLASDYSFTAPSIASVAASITPAPLTVGASAVDKVYDGNVLANVALSSNQLAGDSLTLSDASASFADRNVGSAKLVTVTGIAVGGASATDYVLENSTATAHASITQLASVQWTGGTSGNWSNAANWYNGALPDGANVASVVIPLGTNVTYDAATGPTQLTSLTSQGSLVVQAGSLALGNGVSDVSSVKSAVLTVAGGQLKVNGSLQADTFQISAGALDGNGDFTTGNFIQTGGSIAATLGHLTLGNPGSLTLVNPLSATQSIVLNSGGAIVDANSTTAATLSAPSVQLNAATGVGALASPLRVATSTLSVTTSAGAIYLADTPGKTVTVTGMSTGDASDIMYSQNGQQLIITGALLSKGGHIQIDPPTDVTLAASVQTSGSGSVSIQANNNLALASGASVSTAGGTVNLQASNDLVMSASSSVSSGGGDVSVQAGGNATLASVNAGSGSVSIQATSGQISSATPGANNIVAGDLSLMANSGVQVSYVAQAVHVSNNTGTVAITNSVTGVTTSSTDTAASLAAAQTASQDAVQSIAQTEVSTANPIVLATADATDSAMQGASVLAYTSTDSTTTVALVPAGGGVSGVVATADSQGTDAANSKTPAKSVVQALVQPLVVGNSVVQKPLDEIVQTSQPKGHALMCRAN